MIKQTGRLVGACRFVLAGDGLTLTFVLQNVLELGNQVIAHTELRLKSFLKILIGVQYEIEKRRFSFRLTAPYREERRRAASEAAKNE